MLFWYELDWGGDSREKLSRMVRDHLRLDHDAIGLAGESHRGQAQTRFWDPRIFSKSRSPEFSNLIPGIFLISKCP